MQTKLKLLYRNKYLMINSNEMLNYCENSTSNDFQSKGRIDTEWEDAESLEEKPFYKTEISCSEEVSQNKSINDIKETQQLTLVINEIKDLHLDFTFLRKNFRTIPFKARGVKDKHCDSLIEVQKFQGNSEYILVAKLSKDGRYFATGGKTGLLSIWEIFDMRGCVMSNKGPSYGVCEYFQLIKESPVRSYYGHKDGIIDICWSQKSNRILLTASVDHSTMMWDIQEEYPIQAYVHNGIATCVAFSNIDENIFVSGCFDKIIRLWDISNKLIGYVNVTELITAITFFPNKDLIAVGSSTGRCSVYECNPKLKFSYSFDCKNKLGKYCNGRKITAISFINDSHVLISTNDSRIRLMNATNGAMIQKYKGHLNDEAMIRATLDELQNSVISASDDGNVYIWKKISQDIKNGSYEYFKAFPDKDSPSHSLFLPDMGLTDYISRLHTLGINVNVRSIIINTSTNGKIQVILNIYR